jgi:hypothetical protein
MRKTKAKRDSQSIGTRIPFIALWVLFYFVGMFINQAFHLTHPTEYLTIDQVNIVSISLGLIPVLLQVLMIERLYKRSMRGWLAVTILGTFITLLINPWAWPMTGNSDVRFFLNVAAVIVPPLLFQTIWLWRNVKSAWIWPTLIAARWLFWIAINRFFPAVSESPLAWVLTILELMIEAAVLHALLMHPKDTEKAKVDFATDDQSITDHERLERLQEREHSRPLWKGDDHQPLQKEAH